MPKSHLPRDPEVLRQRIRLYETKFFYALAYRISQDENITAKDMAMIKDKRMKQELINLLIKRRIRRI